MAAAPVLVLLAFCGSVLWLCWLTARRNVIAAGFMFFFLVYAVPAMVGYRFFPAIPTVLRLYFGPEFYGRFAVFVWASFVALFLSLRLLGPTFARRRQERVVWRPSSFRMAVFLSATALFTAWMAVMLARHYDGIDYGALPQIPSKIFSIGFKYSILPALLLWAVSRDHCRSWLEKLVAYGCFSILLLVFFLIAQKAGNRTDIVALGLGLSMYELAPVFVGPDGGLRVPDLRRAMVRLAACVGAALALLLLAESIRQSREPSEVVSGFPVWARLLLNDYYAPAHILFAAMAWDIVQPLMVITSNLANAFLVGGVLHVPYLQEAIGNLIQPGSSTRSTGYGFYIFAEGYMAAGNLGFLYNGVVPAAGILLWSRMARGGDARYNAFVYAVSALSWVVVARSGNHLLVRNLLMVVWPALLAFRFATGANFVPAESSGPDTV